jgi:hypothetical protein
MKVLSAPWSTKELDGAYAKHMRRLHREFHAQHPALMKKLDRLSYPALLRVQAALLELLPSNPTRDYQLRLLRDYETFRKAPRRAKRPQPSVAGPATVAPEMNPDVNPANGATERAPIEAGAARPAHNVISLQTYLGPKWFRGGRSEPHWIGGEV